MTLEKLLYHLNPKNDLESLKRINKNKWYVLKHLGVYAITLPKHIIRGSIVGAPVSAVFGTVTYYLSGNEPSEGFQAGLIYGLILGSAVDMIQYALRTSLDFNRGFDKSYWGKKLLGKKSES